MLAEKSACVRTIEMNPLPPKKTKEKQKPKSSPNSIDISTKREPMNRIKKNIKQIFF